ncbi:NAD(P) transhydrogenase subunit alpha [Occallatibacter riparius]|uniref:proton-translocating NAD(P)(+) transhydrogenase n=1 Tax=Occallatibacter riparius TaxID=1002689 RepID=A0A9J7BGE4_9BACT|nr:NAD(P) transhydrogenase subunit alpha [Occallatibacter riparius]UWZ82060.1 NAD(P) transhydrogenase subunit alpha [Occallatibacter riparius]
MLLGILKETSPGESRVALLPESLKGLKAQGIDISVEAGAGAAAGARDADYAEAGATITTNRADLLASADVLPGVNALDPADQARLKAGAVVIGFLKPLDASSALQAAIERGATLFSMELVPRITRAQSMDALSSMATVAGYKAIVMAADRLPRLFPMLMTAAGTVPPAKVFVIGAGVAGLQAIATARRLGAVVEAYDVRAAAGEQVRSLGAKFLDVDLGGINTEGGGGYAAELTEEALDRGRDLITKTAAHSDVIVSTAQVPGRPAPRLIRREAVEAMRPGAVLVDLAAPAGGNCELTKPGVTQQINGVTLLAPLNLPAEVPVDASKLYARNVLNFLGLIVKKGELAIDLTDEVLAGACVAHQGKPVNPRVAKLLEPIASSS